MRCRAAAATVLVALGLSGAAAADSPTVRLVYERGDGAELCPDERALRERVTVLLDGDPFDDAAAVTLTCEISRAGDELIAVVSLIDARGALAGARTLAAPADDCVELASGLELAIVVAIARRSWRRGTAVDEDDETTRDGEVAVSDDARAAAGDSEIPAQTQVAADDGELPARMRPARADMTVTAVATPGERTPARAWRPRASAGVAASVTPDARLITGLAVGAGARRGDTSVTIEARLDVPDDVPVSPAGRVVAWTGAAQLVPCLHRGRWAACGVLSAGWVHGRGEELAGARAAITPWVGAGVRGAWEREVTGALALRVHADLAASLSRTELQVDGAAVWTTPPVTAAAGISAVARFP